MGDDLTFEEIEEVGELMTRYLNSRRNNGETPASKEELLAMCSSERTKQDLKERFDSCDALLKVRRILGGTISNNQAS